MIDVEQHFFGLDFAMVGLVGHEPAFKEVHVADEVGHEAALRMLVNLAGRAELQEPPFTHHGDAVGHGHGLFLVVRDHDTGHAHLAQDVDELDLRALAQFFVQRPERLVEQQQLGPLGQTARERHALLLSARELVRLALGVGPQLHEVEHFVDALHHRRLLHPITP